ncbi:MlaD family protein [Desulfospira joergensenii]|uniref:MlaD family protein n=1 Tax=Desulfospira joergensenii TaxID=53329 RepID=UPI0003B726DF|nr:MlaD family protein [Desulfospira joergensenii]
MNQNANFFKLGLFVILSFILFAGFLIVFGAGKFLKKELMAETCFDESVQGLDIGSEVKYQGVKIGAVKTITTPARIYHVQSNYVLVTFSIFEECYVGQTGKTNEERIHAAISQGLKINLAFKGLTGAAYLETNYFPGDTEELDISWKPKNLYIPSRKSRIKRLESALNGILENLSQINVSGMTAQIETLLHTLNKKAEEIDTAEISAQMEGLLGELRQTSQKISQTLDSDKFNRIIENADHSFSNMNTILDQAKKPIDGALQDFRTAAGNAKSLTTGFEKSMSGKLETMGKDLDALMLSVNKTAKMLETMIWLNTDTINKTIDNFERTSENLKQLSIEIRQYPGRLLLEKPPKKIAPENLKESR